MNIEELRQIAEIIGSVGETAGDSFYLYLCVVIFKAVWGGVIFLAVCAMLYKLLLPFVTEGAATVAMKKLRFELGTGLSGELTSKEIYDTLHVASVLKKKQRDTESE